MKGLIVWFDREFARLERAWRELIQATSDKVLYQKDGRGLSVGEQVLQSARIVEQTFGGITANLWDDPFEWTLPESLKTPERVAEYLNEVEATRQRGFALFVGDDDLLKEIAVPSGAMQTLCALLVETLVRAAHHPGRAFATFRLFSEARLPRV